MTSDEQDLEPTAPQETEPTQEPPVVEPTPEPPPKTSTPSVDFTEFGRAWTPYIVPETSTATPTSTHTLQYDGPGDTVYIAIHKGERLSVTPEMNAIIQRLRDEGHEFSTVD